MRDRAQSLDDEQVEMRGGFLSSSIAEMKSGGNVTEWQKDERQRERKRATARCSIGGSTEKVVAVGCRGTVTLLKGREVTRGSRTRQAVVTVLQVLGALVAAGVTRGVAGGDRPLQKQLLLGATRASCPLWVTVAWRKRQMTMVDTIYCIY